MYMQVVFVYGLVSPGHTHGVSGLPQAFFSSGKQHALLEMSVLVDIVPLGEVHTAVVFYILLEIGGKEAPATPNREIGFSFVSCSCRACVRACVRSCAGA